jgi:hypothetical protein
VLSHACADRAREYIGTINAIAQASDAALIQNRAGPEQMNIAIQRADTREFLATAPDDWVRDPHEALVFNDTRSAIGFCRRKHLENVRLVVFFRDKRVNLLLYERDAETPVPAGALRPALA